MNDKAIQYLRRRGYDVSGNMYDNYIELWRAWYKNETDFHEYADSFGTRRNMFSLGMAKRVCEDWASVIWSENDAITTDKQQNDEFIEDLVERFNLATAMPKAIEMASWSGTCGAVIRIKSATVQDNGAITSNDDTDMQLVMVDASQIVPLKVEHGSIVDCAFVSEAVINRRPAIYMEIHELTKGGYQVSNVYLDAKNGREIKNDNVVPVYQTGSKTPLFAILEPPKINPTDHNNGLGFSVYGDAIDQIKATDIAYHNFVMDFYLGGKKVFYNKKLIKYRTVTKDDGSVVDVPIYPDDITKQQWATYGDEMANINDNPAVKEYNPDLRVRDNKDGLQFALDLLSFKCGFGSSYYNFDRGQVLTATQYVGDKQDLIQNAKKYRDQLTVFIKTIIRAGLLIGRLIYKQPVTEDCDINIDNVDGFLEDQETIREHARQDVAAGVMSRWEFRMAVYGEDEETARAAIAAIDDETAIDDVPLAA